jgi:hypothetical protein
MFDVRRKRAKASESETSLKADVYRFKWLARLGIAEGEAGPVLA